MITGTSSIPCASWSTPNVNRRTPEIGSMPTVPSASPSPTISSDMSTAPPERRERIASPIALSAKYSGGPNRSAWSASHEAERAGHERAHRRHRERGARPAPARHLVAVERGDHGRGLARHVHEDGRRRAAAHGAGVDAGEDDEGGGGREREGRGDEERHRADGPDAREHADDRPDQHADEAREQVRRREGHAEAVDEALDGAHQPRSPRGSGTPRSTAKR